MAVTQSTFLDVPPGLPEGAILYPDLSPVNGKYWNTGATAIGFGKVVGQGTNAYDCSLGAATIDKYLGIAVLVHYLRQDNYPQHEMVNWVNSGYVMAKPSAAVAVGDPVHFIAATGVLTNTGGVELKNARWETAAAANALAILQLAPAPARL